MRPLQGLAQLVRSAVHLLFVATILAGCARVPVPPTAQTPATRVAITFAFWALEPEETNLTHRLVTRFEQANPDVRVTVLDIPGRYYEKLSVMFAGGTPPDVMVVNYGRLGDLVRRGLLADLQPLLAGNPARDPGHFLPLAWDAFAQVGRTMGHPGLCALPVDWSPSNLLLYDPDALANAGVPVPTGSWTWEQFEAACRKLTAAGGGKQRGASVCLYPYAAAAWLLQGGAELLTKGGRRSALNGADCVRSVEFLKRLQREKLVTAMDPARDRSLDDFRSGQAAMAFVTPYALATLKRTPAARQWALALPLHDRRRVTGCIPSGVAVAARSSQPAAAARFAAFWATEGAQARAAGGWACPAYLPALQSPALRDAFGEQAATVVRQAARIALPHPLSPVLPYEETSGALRTALEQVFTGEQAPREALKAAADKLNRAAQKSEQHPAPAATPTPPAS